MWRMPFAHCFLGPLIKGGQPVGPDHFGCGLRLGQLLVWRRGRDEAAGGNQRHCRRGRLSRLGRLRRQTAR